MVRKEKTRVNIKARLNRHLRIVKENIGVDNKKILIDTSYDYNIVLFFILLIIPVYPTLASLMYNTSRYDFYRGDIDESTIIESYFGGDDEIAELNSPILESTDSFISVNTILDDERDLSGTNEIVDYEVKPGDSFSVIAYRFRVSTNSILWANNFTKKHTLHPGEVIKVPPVSGLIHQIKSGESISSIAKKYDTAEDKIREQNGIKLDETLVIGDVLTIPGAIKKIVKPVYKKPKTYYTKQTSGSQYVKDMGNYKLTRRKPYSGVAGNCTWFVASYADVNWRGNANRWIVNARAQGHIVSQTPKKGSIVQFTGRGYNLRYGHVGIVVDVTPTHIIVKDMNYRKLYEVTTRKIKIGDRTIDGYIYIK